MEQNDLDNRSRQLEEIRNSKDAAPVALRLDIMKKIIVDLEENPLLKEYFPYSVLENAVIAAFENDLKIADLESSYLSDEQKTIFKQEIAKTLKKHILEPKEL